MKIYTYILPNNESFYFQYAINGLKKLGHEIVQRPRDISPEGEVKLANECDFIFFYGFSFMNHLMGQGISYFLPHAVNKPYVVHWCDNPFRYMWALKELINDPLYTFFCCDNNLTNRMKKIGFKNTHYLPTFFDPAIQYPRQPIPNYMCDVSFAGSMFKWETLQRNRRGRNSFQTALLNSFLNERTAGKYWDYVSGITEAGIPVDTESFSTMAFCNLMEQKYLLRNELFGALRDFELHLYGQGDADQESIPPNIIRHGNLNQHTQLPNLYASTKVNTTIELLPSSVHQRIMEVVGCGGFIIGENKEDMDLCFETYITWDNVIDLKEKVKHYLENDSQRNLIAKKMHEEGMSKHRNDIRMKEMVGKL